ncbi:MAG: M20/M25/M40 family metallo-hydrolase [Oscillatoriales cyanobacterium]|uniref:M20/M25/M40 family metallo-hydrolase n=1 Tax=Microcoleus anatoxicus PTRS2 TaxID=2705321 RepID=A0ABU8YRI9_9CYAN|nr:MAG: M20/M25/M40 family metallo-hydrolase [Oscillatoriales cyanobacterium]TAE05201.1 MAG: M20/M25/M40 family metallo-hydrolase [Oscillatoriales cyanobacterium]TAF06892.1 MAG: M20/M25/M40 family metallo-hydrolase [Oscillatoriales cyanobacterium]TAF71505.1 MAG: M20/M25/M40 family metallo-hydrolase [Oscillatoriales cyanobacterium]
MNLKEPLHSHLIQIVRDRHPYLASGGHFYVQQYIREQFAQWGTVEIDDFAVRGRIHHNLILDLPPLSPPRSQGGKLEQLPQAKGGKQEKPIVIGAHYDTVPGTPGADDNATGVAVLLELAAEFASNPLKYPVKLVAFDMEESGYFGSKDYADKLKAQKQSLRLMISLEMLGYCNHNPNSQKYPTGLKYFYPNSGNFIALIGNLRTVPDLINLSDKIRKSGQLCEWLPVPNRGLIVPDTRRSDHAPFWDNGYPAIMVTDTANMRNPHYHQASDRIETLDLDFLAGVCGGLIEAIRHL